MTIKRFFPIGTLMKNNASKIRLLLYSLIFTVAANRDVTAVDFLYAACEKVVSGQIVGWSVERWDVSSGNAATIEASRFTIAQALDGDFADGITFDSQGNLYTSLSNTGVINKINTSGVVSVYASGFNRPSGIVFDTSGNLYISNANGVIRKVSPNGNASLFTSGFDNPQGLAFDTFGNLTVGSNNAVSKVNSAGNINPFVTGSGLFVRQITYDSSGNLFVANNGHAVQKITANGTLTTINSDIFKLQNPVGIVTDTTGDLYVANNGNASISRMDTNGNISLTFNSIYRPRYLAFGPTVVPEPSTIVFGSTSVVTFCLFLFRKRYS